MQMGKTRMELPTSCLEDDCFTRLYPQPPKKIVFFSFFNAYVWFQATLTLQVFVLSSDLLAQICIFGLA